MRRKLASFVGRFIELEASSGIILFCFAVAAMIWANVAAGTYDHFWHQKVGFLSMGHWVNDALMAIFFFLVGLEIKREVVEGEFRSWKAATLPVAAAVGGMVVPALCYFSMNMGQPTARGWGVAMATDIAFALGVLSLLSRHAPAGLRLLLMTLAIVDDLGAVLAIAVFYTSSIQVLPLAGAGLVWATMMLLNRYGVRNMFLYSVLAVALWALILTSGVHATIAGVLIAFAMPMVKLEATIERFHPWVAYAIMPIFALANAGVPVQPNVIAESIASPIGRGILLGLIVGKPLGISLATWLAVSFGGCRLPNGVAFPHILAMGCLGGIGFTMALFINGLAFPAHADAQTGKLAILMASVMAGAVGALILWFGSPSAPDDELVDAAPNL